MTGFDVSRIARTKADVYKGTTADWASTTMVLPPGSVGVDTTLGTVKIGDGATLWNSLGSVATGSSFFHYPSTFEEWLLNGSPSGMFRPNMPRRNAGSNASALTSGVMLSTALYLEAGDVVTNLSFCSGGTGAGTPTNYWFALYDTQSTPALIAQTADQTTTAWGTTTTKTLPLSSPYTVPTTGIYRASIMVAATTVPTIVAASGLAKTNGGIIGGQVPLSVTSGSGLTSTAPATITGGAGVANIPYVVAT